MAGKKYTRASDDRADRKAGIKEGSARDRALDKKRGVPEPPANPKEPIRGKTTKQGRSKSAL